MSSRALRRLREEQEAAALLAKVIANSSDADEDDDDDDGESDDGSDVDRMRFGGVGFSSFMPSDDESSSTSSSSSSEDLGNDIAGSVSRNLKTDHDKKQTINEASNSNAPGRRTRIRKNKNTAFDADDTKEKDDFDDFDAIIVTSAIENATSTSDHASAASSNSTIRALLLSEDIGFDVRDLDSDRAMRSLPLGGGIIMAAAFDAMWDEDNAAGVLGARGGGDGRRQRQQQRLRRHHKKYAFGVPRPEWGKPPSYIGGGIGIYEEPLPSSSSSNQLKNREEMKSEETTWSVPWPYNLNYDTAQSFDKPREENFDGGNDIDNHINHSGKDTPQIPPLSKQKWFTLKMSDTYLSDDNEFRTMLVSSAQHDPNLLAMFVADHPYYAEAMLQLAMVLHYVDDRARGNELLRRTMFLYESALPSSVLPHVSGGEFGINDGFEVLIDAQRSTTDAGLLASLFRTMQLHGMSGRHECALAVGRYLLSLDPLRDPMDVLVILDYYALASTRRQRRTFRRKIPAMTTTAEVEVDDDDDVEEEVEVECGAAFIIELVESNRITIHYKDPSTDRHHWCPLLEMPNFAFSHALALYRLSSEEDGGSVERQRADDALVDALRRFPMVLPKLLAMNGVNTEDRSFRADWPSVLPYFNADASHSANRDAAISSKGREARASGEHLVGIFVRRCHGLWKEESILWWLYQCAVRVAQNHDQQEIHGGDLPLPTHVTTPLVSTFSPALARYATCDPSEYEDSFRTFPPEAIALDPNIVIPAMEVGPHGRRRFLRRGRQRQQEDEEELERAFGMEGAGGLRQLLGLGGNGGGASAMEVLDPDSPLLQLYMQSLLPWTQVEGVRPPAR